MKTHRIAEVAATVVVLVIGLRMILCSLAGAMPYIAALFAMFVVGRCIWYYTRN